MMLIGGANSAEARTALLAHGFGDAVDDQTLLEELEARAMRLARQASWVPRWRVIGALKLDLIAREATNRDKPLNLNPREFALLWRLASTPDEAVSKQTLAQDVLPLGFASESNSIAVHLSRLRTKLTAGGLDGLIETGGGGYRLRCSILQEESTAPWLRGLPLTNGHPRQSIQPS